MLCGDFNFKPTDAEHGVMTSVFDDATPRLADAWTALHSGEPTPTRSACTSATGPTLPTAAISCSSAKICCRVCAPSASIRIPMLPITSRWCSN